MVRNATKRLGGEYDLESRGSAFSCTPTGANLIFTSIYKCGIMLVLERVVFFRDPLYCCTVLQYYLVSSFIFSSRIVLLIHGRIKWCSKEICIS